MVKTKNHCPEHQNFNSHFVKSKKRCPEHQNFNRWKESGKSGKKVERYKQKQRLEVVFEVVIKWSKQKTTVQNIKILTATTATHFSPIQKKVR